MSIVVIDIGTSNITSVVNALKYVGGSSIVTDDPVVVSEADKIVLPGVGAFSAGYDALKKSLLEDPIRKHTQLEKKPFLGICLGMQMLATISYEGGEHAGLDLIPGQVKRLIADKHGYRVPNIGWCNVSANLSNKLMPDLDKELSFYHVHSYYFDCENSDNVVATIEFSSRRIPVLIQDGNIFGVQFHPEKSQDNGLDLLSQFVKL